MDYNVNMLNGIKKEKPCLKKPTTIIENSENTENTENTDKCKDDKKAECKNENAQQNNIKESVGKKDNYNYTGKTIQDMYTEAVINKYKLLPIDEFTYLSSEKDDNDNLKNRFFDESNKIVRYYKEDNKRITEIKTKDGTLRFTFTKRLNYMHGKDLARLARTSKIGNVKVFMSGMYANLNSIKNDKNLDENEKRAAMAQMEAVIQKARIKVKKLKKEEAMAAVKKRAIQKKELKKAKRVDTELKKRRKNRKIREYGQINERPPRPVDFRFIDAKYEHNHDRDDDKDKIVSSVYGDYSYSSQAVSAEMYTGMAGETAAADSSSIPESSVNVMA